MVPARVRAGLCRGISSGEKLTDSHNYQGNPDEGDRHQRYTCNDQSDARADFLVAVSVLVLRSVCQTVQYLV
jgi:hypothetical protein